MNSKKETKVLRLDLASFITHINKTRPRTAAAIKTLLSRVPALETLGFEITPDANPKGWAFQTSIDSSRKVQMWLPFEIEGMSDDRNNSDLWMVASAFAHVFVQLSGRKSMKKQEQETAKLVAEWGIVAPLMYTQELAHRK